MAAQSLEKRLETRLRKAIDNYQTFGVKTVVESKSMNMSKSILSSVGVSEGKSNEDLLKMILLILREEKVFEQVNQGTMNSLAAAVENLSGVILEMMKPADED